MNIKQMKANLINAKHSFDSYKKRIEEMVSQGKKNGVDIVILCDEIIVALNVIYEQESKINEGALFDSDLHYIEERLLKIKCIAGGNDNGTN